MNRDQQVTALRVATLVEATSPRTPRNRPQWWLSVAAMSGALLGAVPACKGDDKSPPDAGKAKAKAEAKPAKKTPEISAAAMLDRAKLLFSALPERAENPDNPITPAKVELGRILYYDPRLSKGQDISCNTCHDLENYGIDVREQDGKRPGTSLGHENQPGERNSPTVYNAGFHATQFWDGRAADLEEQAKGPILNPVEMAMPDENYVLRVLKSIPGYQEKFKAAFPDAKSPISYDNMAKAIAAFERQLVTPAPFDEFLEGKMTALSQEQLHGLQVFLDANCVSCHNGPALGGTQFQKLGNVKPWPDIEDPGRMKVTGNEADKHVFKVPSLRNVTETAPYLHDGSIATLEEMIQKMAEHQSARGKLSDQELDAMIAFMGSLTGEIPSEYIAKPELPANGPKTPAPDPS